MTTKTSFTWAKLLCVVAIAAICVVVAWPSSSKSGNSAARVCGHFSVEQAVFYPLNSTESVVFRMKCNKRPVVVYPIVTIESNDPGHPSLRRSLYGDTVSTLHSDVAVLNGSLYHYDWSPGYYIVEAWYSNKDLRSLFAESGTEYGRQVEVALNDVSVCSALEGSDASDCQTDGPEGAVTSGVTLYEPFDPQSVFYGPTTNAYGAIAEH